MEEEKERKENLEEEIAGGDEKTRILLTEKN